MAKKELGAEDIVLVTQLLRSLRPSQVYAAGDLSDPHGTHRTCLQVTILSSCTALSRHVSGLHVRSCHVLPPLRSAFHLAEHVPVLVEHPGARNTCLLRPRMRGPDQAIFRALEEVKQEAWFARTAVFLYRGAWQEWEPWEADMCVPLSGADLDAKVGAACWLSS